MFHILTDSLLEDHLNCNTKSYLRLRGQSGQATDYSALCSRLDARHRSNASQRLAAQSAISSRHFGGRLLRECLTTGDEIILDALGVAGGMETHFDGLQRIPGDSSLGPYRYRFSRYLRPNSVVHLLLAFDALILGQLQGVVPDDGILICGSELRRIRVRLRTHLDSLVTILTRLRPQSASDNEPPLVLNRHCEVCEFKQLCRSKALEEDNLTLLRGMTLKEMTRHNSKGIFSVKQLSTRSAQDGRQNDGNSSSTTTSRSRHSHFEKTRCMCTVPRFSRSRQRACISTSKGCRIADSIISLVSSS
jgi:predicted RecB family nuclease